MRYIISTEKRKRAYYMHVPDRHTIEVFDSSGVHVPLRNIIPMPMELRWSVGVTEDHDQWFGIIQDHLFTHLKLQVWTPLLETHDG